MIHEFSNLKPKQFELLPRDLTVFVFPLGGLEQHGDHLPFGTRLFVAISEARELVEVMARLMPSWEWVIMPPLPFTADTHTTKLSLSVRPHVVRDALVDQCRDLFRMGFSRFLAASGHATPRQLAAIEDAGTILRRGRWGSNRPLLLSITSESIPARRVFESPMIAYPLEHAGSDDVGLMMAEKKIDLTPNELSALKTVNREKPSIHRWFRYFRKQLDGYWGNPPAADPVAARAKQKQRLELLAPWIQQALESGTGGRVFQSGYRWFFTNGSFFKAYLFAAIFAIMMVLWTLWSVNDLYQP